MNLAVRVLAPILVICGALSLAGYLVKSKKEPRSFKAPPQVTKVEATRLKAQPYQIYLDSQGTIKPRTVAKLIPEVGGRVIEVSPNFRDGGFFEAGEVLLKLDPSDYETAVVVGEGTVAEAKRALHEEKIRGEQALENWRRLGKSGTPSDYVARKPQLAEAEARLRAVEAQLEKARRDLERTQLKAPFDGRIMEQSVDVGEMVGNGTVLARAFSTDTMEVLLPLTNRQLEFVTLPDEYNREGHADISPTVELVGRLGQNESHWSGRVVRVDDSIDEVSRQLFVVAEVEDPYNRKTGKTGFPLKIGMFVDARVKGKLFEQVFVLPRRAVRVGGEVILIDEENRIRRQEVFPIWSEEDWVIVPFENGGINEGDVLCLTPLAYPANGARVEPTIDGVSPTMDPPDGGKQFPMTRKGPRLPEAAGPMKGSRG